MPAAAQTNPKKDRCRMQKSDYRLNVFSGYAKDVKTPKELYEAIEKLGPLPRYWLIGVNDKQEDDIPDFDSAEKDAQIIYEAVTRVAINLRKSNPSLPPLPPPQIDPFLGVQTIKEWCIDTTKTQPDSGDLASLKTAKTGQKSTPAKRQRIRKAIYSFTIFLAALLTCLYLFWWLWTKFSA